MFESPREMYALVEEHFGARWAKIGLGSVLVTVIVAAILAVGTLVYHLTTKVILPMVAKAPSLRPASDLVLSIAISVALLTVIVGVLVWRFVSWRRLFAEFLKHYAQRVNKRLDWVEQNAPSIQSVVENVDYFEKRISELEKRVPDPVVKTQLEVLARLLTGHPTVRRLSDYSKG